jgi:hypothetical protein
LGGRDLNTYQIHTSNYHLSGEMSFNNSSEKWLLRIEAGSGGGNETVHRDLVRENHIFIFS